MNRNFWLMLVAILMSLCGNANAVSMDGFLTSLKTEFKEAEYGMNLVSMHVPHTSTNNGNIGVYVVTKSGFVADAYYNSYHLPGLALGWKTPEWNRMSLTLGATYGYKIVSGLDWTPMVTPEARLATFANPTQGVKELNVRMVVGPNLEKIDVTKYGLNAVGLWHLLAGVKF